MADTMADRHDAPRYALTLFAEVTEPLNSTVLSVRSDVSRSGCYIDTLNPLPSGTSVIIQLRSGDAIFETPARVVYVCPGLGMGVHWGTQPPDKQFAVLDRWLQQTVSPCP
jgi:PilZ domain-containing protein